MKGEKLLLSFLAILVAAMMIILLVGRFVQQDRQGRIAAVTTSPVYDWYLESSNRLTGDENEKADTALRELTLIRLFEEGFTLNDIQLTLGFDELEAEKILRLHLKSCRGEKEE
jgi:outer membrane protein assembly factor BamD (BamD/ComL family)